MAAEMRNDEGGKSLLQFGADVVRLVEDVVTRSTSLLYIIEDKIEPHLTDAIDLARQGAEADELEWENPDDNPVEGLDDGVSDVKERIDFLHSAIVELNVNMGLLYRRMREDKILLDREGYRVAGQDFEKKRKRE